VVTEAQYPDCESCEAPCCRRQFIDDDEGWFDLAQARELYRDAGTTVKVVGWHRQPDGRQPMLECQAFDIAHLRCSVYEKRPEHCRIYDCREDDPDDWEARPHCDLARHRRRATAASSRPRAD
jgi:Fe-S-cluster containining protein